jgi:hypothetical protein
MLMAVSTTEQAASTSDRAAMVEQSIPLLRVWSRKRVLPQWENVLSRSGISRVTKHLTIDNRGLLQLSAVDGDQNGDDKIGQCLLAGFLTTGSNSKSFSGIYLRLWRTAADQN